MECLQIPTQKYLIGRAGKVLYGISLIMVIIHYQKNCSRLYLLYLFIIKHRNVIVAIYIKLKFFINIVFTLVYNLIIYKTYILVKATCHETQVLYAHS